MATPKAGYEASDRAEELSGAGRPAEYAPSGRSVVPATATDPRVRRTREMLQQALAELLRTRDFEGLSVQEITETAGLNRATFYAHYSDKFALLECMVASRFQALLTSRAVVFDGSCPAAIRGIALGVCDYLAELLDPASPPGDPNPAARGSQRQKHLAPHVEASIAAVVRQMLLDGLRQHPVAGTDPPEMLASAASWAIYGAAREWVATAHRQPSEEFASAVQRLVAPLLGIA